MPLKHKIYFALAAIHLTMIVLFASHLHEWMKAEIPGIKVATTIGDYTGSNNIFSFFAPALSDQPYVIYTIKDKAGKEQIIDVTGKSPDFTNRINNIYGYLTLKEGRSIFSAGLARFISNRYPETDQVRVAMVVQQIPDMNEFKNGKRCQWKFWFYRDFKTNNLIVNK